MVDKIPQPVLTQVSPHLFVTDLARSLAFYADVLGFEIAFTYGEPPFFGQVVRDGIALSLRFVHRPVLGRSGEKDLLSAAIDVSDARALFLDYQAKGARFHQTLRRRPWHEAGHGDFIIEDPDGNLISFGGRTD